MTSSICGLLLMYVAMVIGRQQVSAGTRRLDDDNWHSVFMKRRGHQLHLAVNDNIHYQATGSL